MNNITHALVAAGVKVPSQKQRIWQWLKDQGPHTCKDVYTALNIGDGSTRAALIDMMHRGMIASQEQLHSAGNKRLDCLYSAVGREWAMLGYTPEFKKKSSNRKLKPNGKGKPTPAPAPMVNAVVNTFSPEQFVEALTMAQARQVSSYLSRMFK